MVSSTRERPIFGVALLFKSIHPKMFSFRSNPALFMSASQLESNGQARGWQLTAISSTVRHARSRPLDEVQIGKPWHRKMRQASRFRRRRYTGLQAFTHA
jgi:hypothetical protein